MRPSTGLQDRAALRDLPRGWTPQPGPRTTTT